MNGITPILSVKNFFVKIEVDKGNVLVIIGPNGADKTVLPKSLLEIIPYQEEIN